MNRDTDYRNVRKIQMQSNRSRNSKKSSWSSRHRHDQDKKRHRDRDGKWNRDRNKSLEKRDSSRDRGKRIREERPPIQPIELSSSFPAYNYNAFMNSFIGNNRYNITITPAYTDDTSSSMSNPWNVNSLDGMTMSQSNMNMDQSSSPVPGSSNLENLQMSNFSVNSKRTRWDNPMCDITLSQSNVTLNQSSAVPGSSIQEISQTSNFKVNSKRNRWDNPMGDIPLSQSDVTLNQSSAVPVSSNLEMTQTSSSRFNLYTLMAGIENCPQFRAITPQAINFASPVKEIIQLTKSVLYPPNPDDPCHTMMSKPLGCKKVIVGGLPDKASKEIIKEIFETCGTIKNIRRSRKYCHIQFCDELSVENAIYFSGYRLKIENKNEARYNGNLTVHYSEAQDDYGHKRQPFQYQSAHQENITFHAAPEIHYTQNEASRICEKLKSEEKFSQAACILIHWLEKGECKKKEAGRFYSMIHCIQSQANKLQYEKVKYEETLNQAKSLFKKQMDGNIQKLIEIEKIYNAASLQKCWDNFTKVQRKNIEMWKKQTEEIRNAHLEEVINELEDELIELSDDENDAQKNDVNEEKHKEYMKKLQEEINKECMKKLLEETNSLKCQLEAAQKEVKAKQEESKNKDNQLSAIQTVQQNSMKEILDLNQKYSNAESELKELRAFKCRIESEQNKNSHDGDDAGVSSSINSENDVRLVSLISTFLIVQPFGVTTDCIWQYLHKIDSSIDVKDVEKLMKRFPTLFKEEFSGTEPNLEKKWKFTGFQTFITLS